MYSKYSSKNIIRTEEANDHDYWHHSTRTPKCYHQKITPEEYQEQTRMSYLHVEKMLESASMDELLKSRELSKRFQAHGFLKPKQSYHSILFCKRSILYLLLIGICMPLIVLQLSVMRACLNLFLWDDPVQAIALGLNRIVLNRYYGFTFQEEDGFSKERQLQVVEVAVELDSVELSERLIRLFHQVYNMDQKEVWERYMKNTILKNVTSLEMLEMLTKVYGKTVSQVLDDTLMQKNGSMTTLRNVILENLISIFKTPGLTLKEFEKHDRLFQRIIKR
ncbi:hypothetical protein C9374_002491 [Naegleria lovaniensis]|uniref:Uncharacterized protein n=1 Tax=Naegleria lovaniensis TaxID=51637 RepID=A0AA88GTH5_NAELO|nr:uncharacterized protein C9374_002491 [Naegleria lovaniensis]KAG2386747.1 hypothetical protein C9374_002491 [Naegleria lovaniensis]